jgi:HAD superfamily hydrolase (TIGR01549 family)
MNKFDIIYFDSGGTLYSGKSSNQNTPAKVFENRIERIYPTICSYGFKGSTETLKKATEEAEYNCLHKHGSNLFNHGQIMMELFRILGLEENPEISYMIANLYSGPRYKDWLFPGTVDAIKKLFNAGIKLGIIANTEWSGTSMDRAFEGIGLLPYFYYRVYSGDVKLRKPDLAIFEYAENIANAKGKRVLYVGNDIENDILPAKKFGWSAALRLPNSDSKIEPIADIQFYHLDDLLNYCMGEK